MLLLPLLALLGGCKALTRDAEAVAYRPGTPPTTVVAERDATYTLDARNPNTNTKYGWDTIDLRKGATVGFRHEPDGSLVAIAGEQIIPIPDEDAAWKYTPIPVTRLDRLAVSTRDRCEKAAETTFCYAMLPLIIFNGCVTGEWP